MGLRFVPLPDDVDIGDSADSAAYAEVSIRVPGARLADSITVHGQPILFGVSVPADAPHGRAGRNFVAFLVSPSGRRILRGANVDALDPPALVGRGVPALVREAAMAGP